MMPKRGNVIHNAWLVRVLANSRDAHQCARCGARMFVKGESGLCPVCFTEARQRKQRIESLVEDARSAVADASGGPEPSPST